MLESYKAKKRRRGLAWRASWGRREGHFRPPRARPAPPSPPLALWPSLPRLAPFRDGRVTGGLGSTFSKSCVMLFRCYLGFWWINFLGNRILTAFGWRLGHGQRCTVSNNVLILFFSFVDTLSIFALKYYCILTYIYLLYLFVSLFSMIKIWYFEISYTENLRFISLSGDSCNSHWLINPHTYNLWTRNIDMISPTKWYHWLNKISLRKLKVLSCKGV